jgi:hypothetical protein
MIGFNVYALGRRLGFLGNNLFSNFGYMVTKPAFESIKMNAALKKIFSIRFVTIVLIALLALTALNTYLILEANRQAYSTNPLNYDFALSVDDATYRLKDMRTGFLSESKDSASTLLETVFSEGKSVFLNPGSYNLTRDLIIKNKLNPKIVGNDAVIEGNKHRITVYGDKYIVSQDAQIKGLDFVNCTVRVENSLGTTIEDSKFINSTTALEFANTNMWSEYNNVENCQFYNDTIGIVFRTPINGTKIGNGVGIATGSYASSVIERCTFNMLDFSVGIMVEQYAELSDSQILNTRFWMGQNDVRSNQTALYVDGTMDQTFLQGVAFESFANQPIYMFAIDIGQNCDPAPILGDGVSFLGNWTAKVHNQKGAWLYSNSTVFSRQNELIPVGLNGDYGETVRIQCKPLYISEFKPKISVSGSFSQGEIVTVRVRIEYIDNYVSGSVTKIFSDNSSQWLTDDEVMSLFPSQSVIWAVLVDAKASSASSDSAVSVSGYGVAQ